MGFFSYLFGTGQHASKKTDINEYRYLSREKLLDLVSPLKVKTLSQKEEKMVEDVLLERLSHYNKISLENIRDILRFLSKEHTISEIDAKYLYKIFEEYFSQDKQN
ncbi:MAG: hypothetical protein ACD_18C00281G0002 [uncultured bacterium]|nr:MAG: hypothetical protein ACD_18C00281G0002 [uncultured bacterium]OGH83819.1 MAG: hypothetical protein A2488_00220 [Candidatus Magasanikbacteria bacterium RIFOXYC12_FULL_32_21b]HAO52207.1 hypothetical protein [Candidatus Magasanikbacteria bacterium]